MKKFIALITALVLMLALVGCSGDGKTNPSTEPSTAPSEDNTPAMSIADFWAEIAETYPDDLPRTMELNDEDLQTMYGIDASKLEEYTAQLPMMNVHATEFFIAKVKDGEMDAVKAGIQSRLDTVDATWSSYLPEQYELVQNHQIVEAGNYILFAISEKAEAIADTFRTTYGG